jgi:hypothetical protein
VQRVIGAVLKRPQRRPRAPDTDDVEEAPSFEGRLEPNTAALMEGAPPGGASGRVQPLRDSSDPEPPPGPSEGDVENLPG